MLRDKSNEEIFAEKGIKNTKQRNMVFDIIKNLDFPVSAEQIYCVVDSLEAEFTQTTIADLQKIINNEEVD